MDCETLRLLIKLYEDVMHWRIAGGDRRDLQYVLETLDKIDPQAVKELRQTLPKDTQ